MHSVCNTKFQQLDWDVLNNLIDGMVKYMEDKVKNLVVIFDSHLSFEHHIKSLCPRLNGSLSYLIRVKNALDQNFRIFLINALIFSDLNYYSSIWGKGKWKTAAWSTKMYQRWGKSGKQWEISKTRPRQPLLRDLKWINFNSILRLNEASFIHKNLHVSGDVANVKNINFDLGNKVSQRITRNGSDIHHIDYRRTCSSQYWAQSRMCMEFDPDKYQKYKHHRYVQKSHMYQHLLEHQ